MAGEYEDTIESQPKSQTKKSTSKMTLDKAVEMGEYDPKFLSTFPEWASFTNNIRWHYIRDAIKNRRRFMLLNWAETNNVLDLRLKPEMKTVMDNINKQLEILNHDEEKLRQEYLK